MILSPGFIYWEVREWEGNDVYIKFYGRKVCLCFYMQNILTADGLSDINRTFYCQFWTSPHVQSQNAATAWVSEKKRSLPQRGSITGKKKSGNITQCVSVMCVSVLTHFEIKFQNLLKRWLFVVVVLCSEMTLMLQLYVVVRRSSWAWLWWWFCFFFIQSGRIVQRACLMTLRNRKWLQKFKMIHTGSNTCRLKYVHTLVQ